MSAFEFSGLTNLGLACDSTCVTCSDTTSTSCTSCQGLRFLDSVTNACVETCPDGTYANANGNVCSGRLRASEL